MTRKEQNRIRMRKWAAEHRDVMNARHKAWAAKNKAWLVEYARRRRAENKEKYREKQMAWRERNRDEVNRKKREYRKRNVDRFKVMERFAEERRKRKKQTDAAYYAKRRASVRMSKAKRRVVDGKPYRPKFNTRIPDWATMGQKIIDVSSPWLWNNLTDGQRAYGREIAIDRYKWRTGT